MTEPVVAKPEWHTGWLWAILAVFLVFGASGLATIAYGVLGLLSGQPWYLLALVVGAVASLLSFLFMAGILYRVDRYRGTAGRRVELFE